MAEVQYDNSLAAQATRLQATTNPPQEEPKNVPVAKGTAKKSIGKTLKNQIFLASAKDVGKTLWQDNLLPGIKRAVIAAINKWLFNEDSVITMATANRIQKSIAQTIQVNNQNTQMAAAQQTTVRSPRMFETVFVYNNVDDARGVLDVLLSSAEKYGKVRVSDMYEFSSLSFDPQWLNWGWTYADVSKVSPKFSSIDKQWYIEMPQAKPYNQI